MPEFLASKVVVTEEAPSSHVFAPSPAAVTGILGTTMRGPVGKATLCTSFEEFEQIFGGYATGADLPQSAEVYFENGGSALHVVRVVHYADVANADTETSKPANGAFMADAKPAIDVQAHDHGSFGNALRLDLRGTNDDVELKVSMNGALLEKHQRLSFSANSKRYLPRIVNRDSVWVRLTQRDVGDVPLAPQAVQLTGGDDGLSGIRADDFIGHRAARTGLHALDSALDVSILCVPSADVDVQQAMLIYAEGRRNLFVPLSLPAGIGAQAAVEYVTGNRLAESTEHAAAYWPRVLVRNPAPALFDGPHLAVPPCAFIAGIIARLAGQSPGGVYTPPAGIEAAEIIGAVGFDHDDCLDERKRDLVFPQRINPLTTGPSLPLYIDGSRTLKSAGLCPYVSHRRGMSYIGSALWRQLQFVRHKPVTSGLLGRVHRDVTAYLTQQLNLGAFASRIAEECFTLRVGRTEGGIVEIKVGLAFAEPGEFVWLRLSAHDSQGDA